MLLEDLGGSDCELVSGDWLSQPVNAVSSAAFVLAAAVVLARDLRACPGRGWEVAVYSALLALVGVGSVVYHGPQWAGAEQLHDWPIPALIVLILVTPLVRGRRGLEPLPGLTRGRLIALGAVGAAGAAAYLAGRTSSPLCVADGPLQMHGLWHALAAVCFAIIADILYRPRRRG